ncbi:MAG: hypothetical protein HYR88_17200 [Verrucomicrobia bacterium]|nr:hypothetical protein [Verrucomicrobiota bacterium]MBI3867220.1 hypothetical protein [Verrucomicrobiota bacterium]
MKTLKRDGVSLAYELDGEGTPVLFVQGVGVLGAGQMGAAAAALFRRAGFHVRLWTRDAKKLQAVSATLAGVDAFLDERFGPSATTPGRLDLEPDLAVVALRDKQIVRQLRFLKEQIDATRSLEGDEGGQSGAR